jgi:dihydropteroate synthase
MDETMDPIFDFSKRTYIMGILNVTSDSFSGDGIAGEKDILQAAIEKAQSFVNDGADILDIGGESTRPGAQPVSLQEEMDRVIPVVEAIHKRLDVPISVDTYKSQVARSAIEAGAAWINDVWGLHADPEMAGVAAQYEVPIVLMHNRSKPSQAELQQRLGGRYIGVPYDNLIEDVKKELLESVVLARTAGVTESKIILDPGIGFGKTVEQNLELVNRLGEIKQLGYPVLLGASRKSFIGYTLNLPPDERLEGTEAVCAVGIVRGADILRVHDVKALTRVARMTDAILRTNTK